MPKGVQPCTHGVYKDKTLYRHPETTTPSDTYRDNKYHKNTRKESKEKVEKTIPVKAGREYYFPSKDLHFLSP